ncbi:U-box domain-containing protein 45 [Carex littledalei]|uniref:RING-type E3 ubiquitin transferase n=1 Tax=Carex littledalei TaxID=544730 RepID=A0A833QY10_9POAL|nr:U-box domain-containing protein 45 [Carex littledalei]
MDHLEEMDDFVPSGNWKLHGGMCQQLWSPLQKLLGVFPKVEAARPGSAPGIQALSLVNLSIHKSKGLLEHCSEYSKLYLAVTGNSLPMKFEKERSGLVENIKTLEELVVSELRSKLVEVRVELEAAVFSLDESEKQIGEELFKLIQKDPNVPTTSAGTAYEIELEAFYQAATKLGINSYRTALVERRSLKKLLEQARTEDDKLKEKVVDYLLQLMQKYSKLYRTEGDPDSNCSSPRSDDGSPMKGGSEIESVATFNSQVLEVGEEQSGRIPAPPEELKCPISLQLMYDPVVISSGQTFERVSIEKWFGAGHTTCPKNREYLSHTNLTPNSCVKRLIASWCEQNGVPVPANPPDSPDITPFQCALSEMGAAVSYTPHEIKLEEEEDEVHKYKRWMETLNLEERERWEERKRAMLEIRYHLKDDVKARIDMGKYGFVDPLVKFLREAIAEKDDKSQEVGALALFNLAVNNNRNKELMISAGIIPLMDEMIDSTCKPTIEAAIALYLNISCLNAARPLLVQTRLTSFLIESIHSNTPLSNLCRMDALFALFNLSNHAPNVPLLLNSGIIPGLQPLVKATRTWADKAMSILAYVAQEPSGNNAIRKTPGLISSLASLLDSEVPSEQEQSVSCLLTLCSGDERCMQMALQEGVIPALVMLSANGTARAKDKAQRLLKLFRGMRNRELPGKDVIQLDKLKLTVPEIKEPVTSQPQERIRRNASVNAAASKSPSSSNGDDTEEVTEGPKGLSSSRSKRFGRTMVSLLKPKHNSRRTK